MGIEARGSAIIGHPFETKKTAMKTIKFIRDLDGCDQIYLGINTPYPGTELYKSALKLNLIPKKIEWEHFSHQSPENAFTKYITKEEFQRYVKITANLIDKHNSSFKRKLEYTRARLSFYMKNPNLFIKRILEELRRR